MKLLNPLVTVEEVKKKLIKVRQQFSHEHAKVTKRKIGKTGNSAGEEDDIECRPWWYEPLLSLSKHVKGRKSKSTLDTSDHTDRSTPPPALSGPAEKQQTNKKAVNIPSIDASIEKTLNSLQNGENDKFTTFGNFAAQELREIQDSELANDAIHEINNILYQTIKQFIAPTRAGVIIESTLFFTKYIS
ncbi:hypothetical protein Zmor_006123 [Zophobas morio]|uniref:MADF domain-containing protein n=1 Tax=Zophobas morio TaxID=2755281 RepID=A0AA38IWW4_9CUCU|nr:hypothetical protein Zmor_006123 [Zophobas morio]